MTAPHKVFISYSRKDRESLQRLETFLKPLERDGLIDAWSDTRIQAGLIWKEEIDTALDRAPMAVLLISSDFLASDFICNKEMPRILSRANRGELTILSIFLRHADLDDVAFAYTDDQGRQQKDTLTRFQGFGKPNEPLSEMSWSDQERVFTEVTRRIRELTRGLSSQTRSASNRSIVMAQGSVQQTMTEPARAYQLTVHLSRQSGSLHVRYYLENGAELPHQGHCTGQKIKIADIVDKYDALAPLTHSRAASGSRAAPLACLVDLRGCFESDQIHSEKHSWLGVYVFLYESVSDH